MSFDDVFEKHFPEMSQKIFEQALQKQLKNLRESGSKTFSECFSSIPEKTREVIVNTAWKNALLKAVEEMELAEASRTATDAFRASREEPAEHITKREKRSAMTKEEFLALTSEEIKAIEDAQRLNAYYSADNSFPERSEQSVLNKYGYSVAQGNGMSKKQRQEKLADLIDYGIVTKWEVIRHLEYLIKINGKKEDNYIAVLKWKEDLAYVKTL